MVRGTPRPRPERPTAARPDLRGARDQPLSDLAEEHTERGSGLLAELKPGDVSHFRKHWLGDWWPGKRSRTWCAPATARRSGGRRTPASPSSPCGSAPRRIASRCTCARARADHGHRVHPPPKEGEHEPVDNLTEDEPILVVKVLDEDDRKVKADVEVLVPDDKAPIIVHRLQHRPDQPAE